MAWSQADSLKVWPWLFPLNVTQYYRQNGEVGVDLGMAMHTPITSLTLGQVVITGWYGGGGVVCVASQLPDLGPAIVYYQHLDTIDVEKGQIVHVGDAIGLSGGQLHGGYHPATCCSTGPHMEIGINPPRGALWRNLGPSVDPLPWLHGLIQHGPPARDLAGGVPPDIAPPGNLPPSFIGMGLAFSTALAAGTGPVSDTFLGIEQRIDNAMQFVPINWSTITAGTHWWDYVMPWQQAYIAAKGGANISDAVGHNIGAGLARALVMLFGWLIIMACLAAIIMAGVKASGADQVIEQLPMAAVAA